METQLACLGSVRAQELPGLQEGVNFALFSSNASEVALCLFTEADLQQGSTTHEVVLDPKVNRRGDVWHILLPQLDTSLLYGELPLKGCSTTEMRQARAGSLRLAPVAGAA